MTDEADALERSMSMPGVLLTEGFRGKPYAEVRSREVEDGLVRPWELDEPYPYRILCAPGSKKGAGSGLAARLSCCPAPPPSG